MLLFHCHRSKHKAQDNRALTVPLERVLATVILAFITCHLTTSRAEVTQTVRQPVLRESAGSYAKECAASALCGTLPDLPCCTLSTNQCTRCTAHCFVCVCFALAPAARAFRVLEKALWGPSVLGGALGTNNDSFFYSSSSSSPSSFVLGRSIGRMRAPTRAVTFGSDNF